MNLIDSIHFILNTLGGWLSVWAATRAAGFTAYLLLFIAMTAGLLQGGTWAKGAKKAKLNLLHQWSGWFGILFGMTHGLILTYESYIHFDLFDILVPFGSDYEQVWSGFGTLSLYGMILLVASSDLMKKLGKKLWRTIHFLAAPTYMMALIHGIMEGSDSTRPSFTGMYAVTGLIVIGLILYRIRYASRAAKNKLNRRSARSA
ncbi:ferric reductase-like transmembrane domain-containing protein [Paenibacillus physcomitrellae]|uniref:Ferric reductase n=1 Tax=Paenibacillus physcomitrellae TaxID=1619311 RepID=A0ABQ1GJQ4_9BACL|nr:ferric reductase-like transmembrane domain-containing protein [Paenibacillus physcomitrellae]GGA44924.1 ferric reductase [Paenibacillus physcomitrellae]